MSDLPPGCRITDIPGNRPEDVEEEAFWEFVYSKADEFGLLHDGDLDKRIEQFVEVLRRDIAAKAFAEGRDEGALDVYAKWEQRDREAQEAINVAKDRR